MRKKEEGIYSCANTALNKPTIKSGKNAPAVFRIPLNRLCTFIIEGSHRTGVFKGETHIQRKRGEKRLACQRIRGSW